jgi:Mg-chelatase subunit ChlD
VPSAVQMYSEEQRPGPYAFARKPKRLNEAPTEYRRGTGGVVVSATGDKGSDEDGLDGSVLPAVTNEVGTVKDLESVLEDSTVDPAIIAAARQVASRLALRRRESDRAAPRGPGRTVSLPYRGDADEIDIEATLEVLTERRMPEPDDIIVRTRIKPRRAVALIVDVSGSMKGIKAGIVAAAVGALCGELQRDELHVMAFWKDCALLTSGRDRLDPARVFDDLVRLPTRGLTNIHVGLELAARELNRSAARERVAVLLSDCVHNAGPDPRAAVSRLPRLHVLLQVDGEHDAPMGRELARLGGGRLAAVNSYREVAPALNALLAP